MSERLVVEVRTESGRLVFRGAPTGRDDGSYCELIAALGEPTILRCAVPDMSASMPRVTS